MDISKLASGIMFVIVGGGVSLVGSFGIMYLITLNCLKDFNLKVKIFESTAYTFVALLVVYLITGQIWYSNYDYIINTSVYKVINSILFSLNDILASVLLGILGIIALSLIYAGFLKQETELKFLKLLPYAIVAVLLSSIFACASLWFFWIIIVQN